jgi:hypothetical protein
MRLTSFLLPLLAALVWTGTAGAQEAAPAPPLVIGGPPPPPPPPPPVVYAQPPASAPQYGAGYPQSAPYLDRQELRHWHDGDPIPPGYHSEEKARDGLVVAGGLVFGIPWGITVLVAASSRNSPDQVLYAPILGPCLRIRDNNPASNDADIVGDVFLAMDCLVQAAGAAMIIIGATTTKTVLVRNVASMPLVVPMRFGNDGYGLGVVSQF